MIWLVLNCRFEDSWSVTSTTFNRTPISSLISNHHWAGLMLSLLAYMQLFNGCNTVFATTSANVIGNKAEHDSCGYESFTCPRKLKPEKYGSCTGSLLRWRLLWKRGPGTGAVRKSFAGWLAWPWKQMFPFSSLARVSQAASPGVHTVSRRGW